MRNYYKAGTWNVICDVCGFQFKSDQVRKRWDGLIVCHDDYERDHPSKYLRVHPENTSVPFVRSEPEETFESVCYIFGQVAYAGIAEAGCAKAGDTTVSYSYATELKGS